MNQESILCIGKIVGVHGISGEIKVYPYAESMNLFNPGNRILVKESGDEHRSYTVRKARQHKRILCLAFEGIDDRNAAEALVGAGVFVQRSVLPETEEDTWYWCDLIGLDVFGTDEDYVGQITSIIETGSNDVYVVQNGEKETLIPAIATVVVNVDLETRRMQVDLPEGL